MLGLKGRIYLSKHFLVLGLDVRKQAHGICMSPQVTKSDCNDLWRKLLLRIQNCAHGYTWMVGILTYQLNKNQQEQLYSVSNERGL